MRLRILIVPDKFKGTLTASDAARAIARGWRRARPGDLLTLLPMSDGGDGFGAVLGRLLRAQVRNIATIDAAHRRIRAQWWWEPRSRTALVESARVIGLAGLPPKHFHPFQLDTFGLGAVLRSAAAAGAKRCIVGIGGSATNDGGFGLARALGWKFLDRTGAVIERWTNLHKLASIQKPASPLRCGELLVAVDVKNPLLGVRGATRVYGPQKGLRREDFAFAERRLRRMTDVFREQFGSDPSRRPGAGAAGGLGYGLLAFAGGRAVPGFDLFADIARLDRRLCQADVVLTGEGRVDRSTFMGKGIGQVLDRCREREIPCVVFAGAIAGRLDSKPAEVRALTDLCNLMQAKSQPGQWLAELAEDAAKRWNTGSVSAPGVPQNSSSRKFFS